eukprot:COSAG02_NODE_15667_length_1150_cov_1.391056_2_plen_23_part_01
MRCGPARAVALARAGGAAGAGAA